MHEAPLLVRLALTRSGAIGLSGRAIGLMSRAVGLRSCAIIDGHVTLPSTEGEPSAAIGGGEVEGEDTLARPMGAPCECRRAAPAARYVPLTHIEAAVDSRKGEARAVIREAAGAERAAEVKRDTRFVPRIGGAAQQRQPGRAADRRHSAATAKRRHVEPDRTAVVQCHLCAEMRSLWRVGSIYGSVVVHNHEESDRCAAGDGKNSTIGRACNRLRQSSGRKTQAMHETRRHAGQRW